MATAAARARQDSGRARSALRARLEARREEIEAVALTRVRAISDPAEVSDPAYAEGLRAALAAAIDYGLEATGRSAENAPPIPVALLAQARLAARVGIPLDTVLRRYFAGYSLLGYFLMEEASREGLMDGAELQRLVAAQAGTFDRLLAAIGEEHTRESEAQERSTERRQAERIERLLAGEMVDTSDIPYDFAGRHLGLVLDGSVDAEPLLLRDVAARLGCRILIAVPDESSLWAWLGGGGVDPTGLSESLAARLGVGCTCAVGEPGQGLCGWRSTHRQAVVSLGVARRHRERVVRYADVALLASILHDDLLTTSLRRLYLEPLNSERDGGEVLRATLRAYIRVNGSLAAAAAMLNVSPRTISNRLHRAEAAIGRSLNTFRTEIDAALRIESAERAGAVS